MATNESLKTLFVEQLQDLYDAEQQLTKVLQEMSQSATSKDLQQAFEQHLEQTRTHIERLDQVFKTLGETPTGKTCKAMQGLVQEGKEEMQRHSEGAVRDAALIAAAQRVEHYEIAGYGTVRSYADVLGHDDVAKTLQQTLDEEGETDQKLTGIATGGLLSKGIDQKAAS